MMSFIGLIGTLFLALSVHTAAQTDIGDALMRADAYADAFNVESAKKTIDSIYSTTPDKYEVLWRMARIYIQWGDRQPPETREAIYKQAMRYGDSAVRINPTGMEGFNRRAAAKGKLALYRGVFSVGGLVRSARNDALKALELDNAGPLELSIAHYILGRIHLKLAEKPALLRWPLGLGFGSLTKALYHLETSVALRPGFIMYSLDYAKALIEDDELEMAKRHLHAIAGMTDQDIDDGRRRKLAARLLNDLENNSE